MSKVLVALDRAEAEAWLDGDASAAYSAAGSIEVALRAALDTDREARVDAVAEMVFEFATGREWWDARPSERAECADHARAVLALLEGGQE